MANSLSLQGGDQFFVNIKAYDGILKWHVVNSVGLEVVNGYAFAPLKEEFGPFTVSAQQTIRLILSCARPSYQHLCKGEGYLLKALV